MNYNTTDDAKTILASVRETCYANGGISTIEAVIVNAAILFIKKMSAKERMYYRKSYSVDWMKLRQFVQHSKDLRFIELRNRAIYAIKLIVEDKQYKLFNTKFILADKKVRSIGMIAVPSFEISYYEP